MLGSIPRIRPAKSESASSTENEKHASNDKKKKSEEMVRQMIASLNTPARATEPLS